MTRKYLPILDRRIVLRGLAATLAMTLTGCGVEPNLELDADDPDEPAPDGGSPTTPGPGFARCGNELCLELADPANAALRVVDGARVIVVDNRRLLVVRIAQTTFIVLSAVCTHSGCTVRYAPERADVVCPCHGSTFDLDGTVTHGPAATPLARFETRFDETTNVLAIALPG